MLFGAFIDIITNNSVIDEAMTEPEDQDQRIDTIENSPPCPFKFKDLCNQPPPPSNPSASIKTPIYDGFRLPIEYVDPAEVYTVTDVVMNDLELSSTDSSFCLFPAKTQTTTYSGGCISCPGSGVQASIYEHFICPTNIFSGEMTRDIQKRYTTNVLFLEDTQQVLSETTQYSSGIQQYMKDEMPAFQPNADTLLQLWKDTKEDADFLEKYSYLEWSILEHLNHSSEFLQLFSLMNIMSPIFSLMIPLLFLVFPFVILRLKQVEITMEQYIETLREIAKHHFIGKALSSDFTVQGIGYLLITAGLYFMQTYQNVNSCIRYYRNITKMNEHLELMRDHVRHSIKRMEIFVSLHKTKPTYVEFCKTTETHISQLRVLYDKLSCITPFSASITKAGSVGYMLQCYYQLYSNPLYEKSIRYSIGFGAYMDVLLGISIKLKEGHLGKATFVRTPEQRGTTCASGSVGVRGLSGDGLPSKDNAQTSSATQGIPGEDVSSNVLEETNELVFCNQYYPTHSPSTCIRNTCDASRNLIITGVNASGKTTFLKTTAINILVTQQFGVGFYSSATIRPFTHIHSYLNIPDTSGRDSLFQAESRRCKEIIDAIESSNRETDRHYVLFDELYSGTNPEEATKSAVSLLRYLSKYSNVRFMLTTHYLKVCKKFRKSDKISNYKMNVELNENGSIRYLYKLKKGISKIQGGVEILKQMNYPEEILRDIRNTK